MAQTGPRDKATIEALKERMARDPLSRAFLQLAEEYRKAGRFEEAVQVCQEGLARHPGYHTARIALGRTYLDAGDLESAHQALTEVLDTMPENHLAAKLLAEVQLRLGNHAGAAETYRVILNHYPGDREVEGLLSELGEGGGAADGAPGPVQAPVEEADLGAAIPAAPETASLPPQLEVVDGGESFAAPASADEMTAASSPTDEQTTAAPAEADALQTNTLAELYLRQGLVEKALEVYHAMLRVDSGNEHVRRRLEELSGDRTSPPGLGSTAAAPAIPAPALSEPIDPAGGSESAAVESPAPPESPVSDMAVRSGLSAPPVGEAEDEPAPAALPETVIKRGAGTIGRLERWLATIQSASMPVERESRR